MYLEGTTERPEKIERAPNLTDAPGVVVGSASIEWGGSAGVYGLSDREVELVKQKLGVRSVNVLRTQQIKSLMKSKTCAQIVQHFRGRKGYRSSTIKHTHAALSQAEKEKRRDGGAK